LFKKVFAVSALSAAALFGAGAPALAYGGDAPEAVTEASTDGSGGLVSGNQVNVPVGVDLDLCGAVAAIGLAGADCSLFA